MTQTATASPAQIDAQIARISGLIAAQEAIIDRAMATTERIVASRYFDEATDRPKLDRLQGEVGNATIAASVLDGERRPFTAEFTRRGGWTRYYLVEGGHLHYDVSAHRCSRIDTTSHYWMTDLSGRPADEVIELAGDRVCTVCFPQAPVAVQNRPSVLLTATEAEKAQARDEREAKRTAAALAKAAKAIVDPETGGELRIADGGLFTEHVKTERAAAILVVDYLWYERFYGTDALRVAGIEKLLAALAAKRDTTVEIERAEADKRLVARIRREAKFA